MLWETMDFIWWNMQRKKTILIFDDSLHLFMIFFFFWFFDTKFLFFTVMETDIRAPPEEVGILINLSADAGTGIEAKCLSINPIFNE